MDVSARSNFGVRCAAVAAATERGHHGRVRTPPRRAAGMTQPGIAGGIAPLRIAACHLQTLPCSLPASMRDAITHLILQVAREQQPPALGPTDLTRGAAAGLYGPEGALDSLALVRLLIDVESALQDRYGVAVVLASERAMSRKHSPFLTVGSLAGYVEELLSEAGVKPPA
jgi:hypothetical protein